MPIDRSDLPGDIQAILDSDIREGAPVGEQPVCSPDGRVTAQLTDRAPPKFRVLPWRVGNAQKGDLLLTPGGEGGLIGGILWRLDRRQYFSHMGIFIDDGATVRHATAIGDRAKHERLMPTRIFDTALPLDGIAPDAVRHQWPGTVTQTVEEAYLTQLWHPTETVKDADGNDVIGDDGKPQKRPHPSFSRYDPVTAQRWHIDALTFDVANFNDKASETAPDHWIRVPPVVVKPCRYLETAATRHALHRIADAARQVHGHYRIYAYSKGDISLDPGFLGPPLLEVEQRVRRPGCTGALTGVEPLRHSLPLVCSTFVWHATQVANADGGPKIILDHRPGSASRTGAETTLCRHDPLLFKHPIPDVTRIHPTVQGMYSYSEQERLRAGRWLHDEYLVPSVRHSIEEKVPGWVGALGGAAGALPVVLPALLSNPLTATLVIVAQVLGISVTQLGKMITFLTDMPEDVATQVCNTFAFDKPEEVDDALWEKPKDGFSVSPDDILHEWSPVQGVGAHGETVGVYGHNEVARILPPTFDKQPPPPSTWQISQGGCDAFRGQVWLRDRRGNLSPAHAAQVRIGAQYWYTDAQGFFTATDAVQGLYWTTATYTDPGTGLTAQSPGRPVKMGPGGPDPQAGADHVIELPPKSRRALSIHGKMYLVNRALVGSDWIGQPRFSVKGCPLPLDIHAFGFPHGEPQFEDQRALYLHRDVSHSEAVEDWGLCQLEFRCEPDDDEESVRLQYRAQLISLGELKDLDENPRAETFWTPWQDAVVAPTSQNSNVGQKLPQITLLRKPYNPVRAYIDIEVVNHELG